MYGSIIGDIAGSIYEYDEFNNSEKGIINLEKRLEILTKKDIIEENCFFSDDTMEIGGNWDGSLFHFQRLVTMDILEENNLLWKK